MIGATQMAATHAAAFATERAWSAEEFGDLLQHPGCFAVGDARCFALVRVVVDEAELLTVATAPEHRGQGLARRVMRQWMEQAAEHGATRAFLEVAADNTAARALYDDCGFSVVSLRPGYYRRPGKPPEDALLMTCGLTSGHPAFREPDGQKSG